MNHLYPFITFYPRATAAPPRTRYDSIKVRSWSCGLRADGLEALLQQIDLAEDPMISHGDVDAEEILVEVC